MTTPPATPASCVAWRGRGLLILGASGSGKSSLALELIALGADLVADDHVILRREAEALIAAPPTRLAGLIEARGVGLLRLPFRPSARVALALDLDRAGAARLPPLRRIELLGAPIALMLRPALLSAAAVLAALRYGPPIDPEASVTE